MRSIILAVVVSVLTVGAAGAGPIGMDYRGSGADWKLIAKFKPLGGGKYDVSVTSWNKTCNSQTDETGVLRGQVLVVGGETCPMKITFKGRTARIVEGADCTSHGAGCSFDGTVHANP